MSINFYKVRLLIIIFFFLHSASTFSAIVFGTLVSTPNGLVPVQNLHIGDTVIGYCKKCRTLVESPITKIKKQKGKRLVLINVNNQNMLVSKNQIFFDPAKSKWIRARNITRNNYLLSYELIDNNIVFSKARCHSIQQVKRRSTVYEISLKYPHTFFISKAQILTHNFACSLGLGLAFGSGVISFETIAVSASFLGLGLYSLFGKKSKMKAHIIYNPCNYNHTPNKKPDDDNKKNKKIKIDTDDLEHLFRNKDGHLGENTPENRRLLFELISDTENFLVKDMHGNEWYAKILSDGRQLWASVRNNIIRNGGINQTPRTANIKTGLSRILPPKIK